MTDFQLNLYSLGRGQRKISNNIVNVPGNGEDLKKKMKKKKNLK